MFSKNNGQGKTQIRHILGSVYMMHINLAGRVMGYILNPLNLFDVSIS